MQSTWISIIIFKKQKFQPLLTWLMPYMSKREWVANSSLLQHSKFLGWEKKSQPVRLHWLLVGTVSQALGVPSPWQVCYSLDHGYSFSLDESWSAEQGLLERSTKVPSAGSSVWQRWILGTPSNSPCLRGCTSAPSWEDDVKYGAFWWMRDVTRLGQGA